MGSVETLDKLEYTIEWSCQLKTKGKSLRLKLQEVFLQEEMSMK